jgi:hypothetical protein
MKSRKKKLELEFCIPIACAMNQQMGTDYRPESNDIEGSDTDVLLESVSDPAQTLGIQVVTVPQGLPHLRSDHSSVRALEEQLSIRLLQRGIKGYSIDLVLSPTGLSRGFRSKTIEQLGDLIVNRLPSAGTTLDMAAHKGSLPALHGLVDLVTVTALNNDDLFVCAEWALGGAVSTRGEWIDGAIQTKLKRYGKAAAVADLILVIGNSRFLDDQEIVSFQAKHSNPNVLPFKHIWVSRPIPPRIVRPK